MAKVSSPLLSGTASGSIGPRLTFSHRASGQQVRFQRAQKDVVTELRTAQRERWLIACTWWDMLTLTECGEWNTLTK